MKTQTISLLAGALLFAGCHSPAHPAGGATDSPVLAHVGAQTITVAELQARIDEQPAFLRARFQKLEARKQLLDEMVRFQVLAQEARAEGLDQDPRLKETYEKLLVQRLIEKKSADHPQVTDAELHAYYDAHQSEFVRPEKLRVSQIYLASAGNSPTRSKIEAEATKLLAEIRSKEAGPVKTEFAAMAQKRSDDPRSRAMAGDLGLLTQQELSGVWGKEVASAAFGLKAVGETTEAKSPRGIHLLKLTARIPSMNRSFDSVKSLLQSRVALEQRAKSVDAFVTSSREKAHVQIDDKALAAMTPPAAPSAQAPAK